MLTKEGEGGRRRRKKGWKVRERYPPSYLSYASCNNFGLSFVLYQSELFDYTYYNLIIFAISCTYKRRLMTKTPPHSAHSRSFAASWSWYVRGHIVSRHQQRLIVQFMSACPGKTAELDENEGEDPLHQVKVCSAGNEK